MPGNFKKEDLRIIKTQRALSDVLPRLLEFRSFAQITVNDICEEAQLSRTAFYTHFQDKYDFLKYWLKNVKPKIRLEKLSHPEIEQQLNAWIGDNKKVIKNLLKDANNETQELINEFFISFLSIPQEKDRAGKPSHRYTVLATFCAGGLSNILQWQIKNDFSSDLKMINSDLLNLLKLLLENK